MKHTPGPWRADFDRVYVDKFCIVTCWAKGSGSQEFQANARLIAAAPGLLEALKDLVALYASTKGADKNMIAKGLEAIAKAT